MTLGVLFGQSVTVETYEGAGEFGDTYAAPVVVKGLLDDGLVLTSTGPTGDVVASVTAFYCSLEHAPKFRTESRVTVPSGAVMQVETVKRRQAAPLFTQVEHLEVRLK